MRTLFSPFRIALFAGALGVSGVTAEATAAPRRVLVREVTYRWVTVDEPVRAVRAGAQSEDRLYLRCKRMIRRELGQARGRNSGALRLAYAQSCVARGGTGW